MLTTFVRYDGAFNIAAPSFNKYTVGLNCNPISTLTFKVEQAWKHEAGKATRHTIDVGIGYTLNF